MNYNCIYNYEEFVFIYAYVFHHNFIISEKNYDFINIFIYKKKRKKKKRNKGAKIFKILNIYEVMKITRVIIIEIYI